MILKVVAIISSIMVHYGMAIEYDIPFDEYLKATLQSSGLMPEDKEYMSSFYQRLYGEENTYNQEEEVEELCDCNGCLIYDTCLKCVSFRNCNRINGTFCRN